jgi:hypothetical protein
MTRDMRLALFENELARLLQSGREHDYVMFSDLADPDHYVQYMRHDGTVYGEVGSLEWVAGDLRLHKEAETAFGCSGFSGGGHERNHLRDHLPLEPASWPA